MSWLAWTLSIPVSGVDRVPGEVHGHVEVVEALVEDVVQLDLHPGVLLDGFVDVAHDQGAAGLDRVPVRVDGVVGDEGPDAVRAGQDAVAEVVFEDHARRSGRRQGQEREQQDHGASFTDTFVPARPSGSPLRHRATATE